MQVDLESLVSILQRQTHPIVPAGSELWTADDIAEYLRMNSRQVKERVVPVPGFPQAIWIPSTTGRRGQPRWKRSEVIDWAERHQDRRVA
jgi:hypothetical protein